MKMLVTIKRFLCVLSIMFLSLVQSNPVKLINTEIVNELKNCPYPPEEVRLSEDFMSLCGSLIPDVTEEIDVRFSFTKYICMELLDVSLQLCDPKFASVNFPKSIDDFKMISSHLNVEDFCSKLNFSNTRIEKTKKWANVAIDNLKNAKICEKYCVVDQELNPLCGAIYWANQCLITAISSKPPVPVEVSPMSENVSETPRHDQDNDVKTGHLGSAHTSISETPVPELGEKSNVGILDIIPKTETDNIKNVQDVQGNEHSSSVDTQTQQKNEKMSEKSSMPESPSTSLPPVPPTIPSTVSESLDKVMENSVVEVHDDVNSDTFKSRGMGEVDSISAFSDDETADVESKGSIVEGPISPSVAQEDNYGGEPDEIPASYTNSFNGLRGQDTFVDAQDSHFFAYFLTMVVICIIGYLVFHNKQKIIALALEGRRMQGSRRRPNTSSYKKLDSNLEEAVTSTCSSSSVTHVIF